MTMEASSVFMALRCRVSGLGLQPLGFRVLGGFLGLGFRVEGVGFRALGLYITIRASSMFIRCSAAFWV